MNPSVTVITPTYNCAKYLLETIQSVQMQNYPHMTHLILDDGSTDNTEAMLMASNWPDNALYSRHENIGEAATVNKGMELVNSDYFMVVNADDPLLPHAIENLITFMQKRRDVLVGYPDWLVVNEQGIPIKQMEVSEYSVKRMIGKHVCLPGPGAIYRSEVIDRIGARDTQFRYIADYDYFLRVGEIGNLSRIPGYYASWRKRKGQASENTDKRMADEHIRLVNKLFPSLNPDYDKVEAEARCWAYIVAGSILRGPQGAKYGLKGISCYPQILLDKSFISGVSKHLSFLMPRG